MKAFRDQLGCYHGSQMEACTRMNCEQPGYVDINDILDRLTTGEMRSMLAGMSAAAPAVFEQLLLEKWQLRAWCEHGKPGWAAV